MSRAAAQQPSSPVCAEHGKKVSALLTVCHLTMREGPEEGPDGASA